MEIKQKAWIRLFAATVYWWIGLQIMAFVYASVGSCSDPHQLTFTGCKASGSDSVWSGFDISGHLFLLLHSSLVLIEEMNILLVSKSRIGLLVGLFLGLWYMMMVVTCLYFHHWLEILTGSLFGIEYWVVVHLLKVLPIL